MVKRIALAHLREAARRLITAMEVADADGLPKFIGAVEDVKVSLDRAVRDA